MIISGSVQWPVKTSAQWAGVQRASEFNLIQSERHKAFHLVPERSYLCSGRTECAGAH